MKRKLLLALLAIITLGTYAQTEHGQTDDTRTNVFIEGGKLYNILHYNDADKTGKVEFCGWVDNSQQTNTPENIKKALGTALEYTKSNISGDVTIDGTVQHDVVYGGASQGKATYTVTQLRTSLFRFNTNITKVTIPGSVTLIESRCFDGCTALKNVVFNGASQLKEIDSHAFLDCSSLESITLPNTVEYMGDPAEGSAEGGVFEGCSSLTEFTVPDNAALTTIPNFTFKNCAKLKTIHFGVSPTRLGKEAFLGCKELEWGQIPNTVEYIGDRCFEDCASLTSVDLKRLNLESTNGHLGDWVFKNTPLTSVEWPSELKTVPQGTFENCSQLTEIKGVSGDADAWDNVTEIGNYAFKNCKVLTKITLPKKLQKIDSESFNGCEKLATVEYSNELTTIGSSAFAGTKALKKFFFLGSVKTLDNFAFQGSGLTCVHLKGDMTIGNYVFENCTELKYVEVPDNVKKIPTGFIKGCISMRFITLGKDVESIESEAFANCTKLKYVYMLPTAVPSLDDNALKGTSLKTFAFYVKSSALANYKDAWKDKKVKDKDGNDVSAVGIYDNIPIKLGSEIEYAAISRDFPIEFAGAKKPVEAYVGPSTYWVDNSKGHIKILKMDKVNAVPRLAGVILKGESGQTYSIKIYDENGSHSDLFSEKSANFIKGVKEDTTMVTVENDKAKYGLMTDKMLHLLEDNSQYTGGVSYVEAENDIANSSQAKIFLSFGDDTTITGIDEIKSMDDDYAAVDDAYYTLTGVRLEKADRPGVYIHRGKKTIIR